MTENNQITPGRQQMLLYLAHKNDWVYVTEVFRGADPEGITSLHGARKALRELDYVEMENVTPGRPTYECRLKQDVDTFAGLLNTFIETEYAEAFLKSAYVRRFSIRDPETVSAVRAAILDKFKPIGLVCNAFYPDVPDGHALTTILNLGTPDDVVNDESDVMPSVTYSPFGIGAIFAAAIAKSMSPAAAIAKSMSQMSFSGGLGGAVMGLDEIDEKKQLPPPKTVQ